jgi:hypothetical protein
MSHRPSGFHQLGITNNGTALAARLGDLDQSSENIIAAGDVENFIAAGDRVAITTARRQGGRSGMQLANTTPPGPASGGKICGRLFPAQRVRKTRLKGQLSRSNTLSSGRRVTDRSIGSPGFAGGERNLLTGTKGSNTSSSGEE